MSTIKISQLPLVTTFTANTQNTVFVGVDLDSDLTGQFTAESIARNLYLNETLIVGNNVVQFANVIGQFSGSSPTFLQINNQNFNANGSADYVASTSDSDNTFGFIDMGIEGASYNGVIAGYPVFKPYDGYLYMVGKTTTSPTGNLIIGTQNKANTVFINGGVTNQDIVALMTANGLVLNTQSYITFADNTRQITSAASLDYTTKASLVANNASANSILLQAGLNAANANIAIALSSGSGANSNIAILQAVNLTQNDNITTATTLAQYALGVQATQNTRIQTAQNQANVAGIVANTTAVVANNALANTSGTFAGNLNVNGFITLNTAGGIYQETASPSIMTANTTGIFKIVTNKTISPYTWNFGQNGTTTMPGNLTVSGNVIMTGIAATGQLTVNTALVSADEAAVRITGSNNAVVVEPQNDGYMLQITGKENLPTRLVLDSFGANTYGLLAGRSARGTAAVPTATQNNDVLLRLAGNGYGTTGFAPLGVSRIDIVAAQNFTDVARGSRIEFYNVPDGSNTVTQIASFNANTVTFTGAVEPQKGFIYTPRVPVGNQTAITIDYRNDSMIKANLVADLTVSHSNFVTGKVVEMWLVNQGGTARTVTHGISALNSTENATTFNIPATSSAYLKFFSIDGDLANTFVSVVHA